MSETNVATPVLPPSPTEKAETITSEASEEMTMSYDDYQDFLEWKKLKAEVKKKDPDVNYVFSILKTVGLAAVPALMGALQRALTKTIEQHNSKPQETQS
eukprot:gene330-1085_t